MKKFLLAALMGVSLVSTASAMENIGLYDGTGYIVDGYQSTIDKTTAKVLVVQQNGRIEPIVVKTDCNANTFTLISKGKEATVPYFTKKELTAKNPSVGGYYAIYEKFCPVKSKKPSRTQKCAMTDSGKMCGKELEMYRMHD